MTPREWWNGLTAEQRSAVAVRCGWYRAKDRAPDRTGRKIAASSWDDLSPASQRIIGEKAGPRMTYDQWVKEQADAVEPLLRQEARAGRYDSALFVMPTDGKAW